MKQENKITLRAFILGIAFWLFLAILTILLREELSNLQLLHQVLLFLAYAFAVTITIILSVLIYIKNLTKRHLSTAQSLQEKEEISRVVTETVREGVVIQQNSRIIEANTAAASLFGYSVDEMIGKPTSDFFEMESLRHIGEETDKHNPGIYESVCIRKDASMFIGELNHSRADISGQKLQVTTIRDITKFKSIEADLRAKAELLELSSDTVSVYDFNGNPVYLNQAYCQAHGYTLDELMKINIRQVNLPEYANGLLEKIRRIKDTGETVYENWHRRKDGSVFLLELHSRVFNWGERELILSIGRDITERKQNDELLESIAMNSPSGMYISQDGKFVYVSDQFTIDTGYTKEELLGKETPSLIMSEDQARVRTEIISMLKGNRTEPIEFSGKNKLGERQWLLSSVSSINYRGKRAVLGTIVNITHRKKIEEELQESQRQFLELSNLLPQGVWLTDTHGNFLYSNRKATELFGYTWSDKVSIDSLFIPGDVARLKQHNRQLISGEINSGSIELTAVKKDGRKFPVIIYDVLIKREDGNNLIQGITIDTSDFKEIESNLRISEENIRILLENSPIGVSIYAHDFELLYANRALLNIFGYETVAELKSTPYRQTISPASREFLRRQREKETTEGLPFLSEYEITIIRKDGTERILYIRSTEIMWYGSQRHLLSYLDVTDMKQAEKALKNSEENFRTAMERLPTGVQIANISGQTVFVNQALLDIYGYVDLTEFLNNPRDRRLTPEAYEASTKRRELIARGKVYPTKYETSVFHKDGSIRYLNAHIQEIVWNGERSYQVIYEDITEKKKAEQAFLESHRRFLEMANLLPQSVWELDAEGNFLFWNENGRKMHGYEKDENVNVLELFVPELRNDVIDIAESLVDKNKSDLGIFQSVALRKDGSTFPVLINYLTVYKDGQFSGFRGITVDITERVKYEERERELTVLRDVDKLRSELLANVSHELRTPLVAIKGFTSTLMRKDANWDETQRDDFLATIDKEADRLARLISDLLDMSRLDAGALNFNLKIVTPGQIIEKIQTPLNTLTQDHHLVMDVSGDLPVLNIDETRIGQVIINLVDNAAKFSQNDTEIRINARHQGDLVIFSVQDQGIGIEKDVQPRIFSRFYQIESSTESRRIGTGLGLAICKGIVEGHGGEMWLQSSPGKGSTFFFSLPIENEFIESR